MLRRPVSISPFTSSVTDTAITAIYAAYPVQMMPRHKKLYLVSSREFTQLSHPVMPETACLEKWVVLNRPSTTTQLAMFKNDFRL